MLLTLAKYAQNAALTQVKRNYLNEFTNAMSVGTNAIETWQHLKS